MTESETNAVRIGIDQAGYHSSQENFRVVHLRLIALELLERPPATGIEIATAKIMINGIWPGSGPGNCDVRLDKLRLLALGILLERAKELKES